MNKQKDNLLNTYPSFNEIINNPKYKFDSVVNNVYKSTLCSKFEDWEVLVRVVNIMCKNIYGLGLYESYSFTPIDEYVDNNLFLKRKGYGNVYDSNSKIHTVDFETFIKITLVLYMSFMGIELTDEQCDSYYNFKKSSYTIHRILD